MDSLSLGQARRVALAATGLHRGRPTHRLDRRHVRGVVERLGAVQIDSVNVFARAHLMPFFSRLGPYDPTVLDVLTHGRREIFEYWGHAASFLPATSHPLMRWRMGSGGGYKRMQRFEREHPDLLDRLERAILEDGPRSAGELREGPRAGESWWGWDDVKTGLETLFFAGRVGALRRPSFERLYVAPELAVPASVLDAPTPSPDDAKRALLAIAARACGVATTDDLADHFRLKLADARRLLPDLVDEGTVVPVTVESWPEPAYLAAGATVPRTSRAAALVSPFDPLVWHRPRALRLFAFDYRIEIYVPEAQRRYGYYVLPFVFGDRIAARVDLKADRAAGRLVVRTAWREDGVDESPLAAALAGELDLAATWLGLDAVDVEDRGDLAPALRRAVAGRRA